MIPSSQHRPFTAPQDQHWRRGRTAHCTCAPTPRPPFGILSRSCFHCLFLLMLASVLGDDCGGHHTTPFPGAVGTASLLRCSGHHGPYLLLFAWGFARVCFLFRIQVTLTGSPLSRNNFKMTSPCYLMVVLQRETEAVRMLEHSQSAASLFCCPWKVCSRPPAPCRLGRGRPTVML